MEWQAGRPVSTFDQSSDALAIEGEDYSTKVEQVSNLVLREAALVRQYNSDSMAVVLRPDTDTELFVHFYRRNGQIEATIRCERGDAHQLTALWPQLQESLAQQKVRLAPLQEAASNHSDLSHPTGSESGGRGNHSARQMPDKQFMDESPALATSKSDSPQVRGDGGSRHRRVTTSRPGWETWA